VVEFKVLRIEFARIHDRTIMPRGREQALPSTPTLAELACPSCSHQWTARPGSWQPAIGGMRLACPGCGVDGAFRPIAPDE